MASMEMEQIQKKRTALIWFQVQVNTMHYYQTTDRNGRLSTFCLMFWRKEKTRKLISGFWMECPTISSWKMNSSQTPPLPSNVIDRHNFPQLQLLACLLSIFIISPINESEETCYWWEESVSCLVKAWEGLPFMQHTTHSTMCCTGPELRRAD